MEIHTIINEEGINGTGEGLVNQNSIEFKELQRLIKERASEFTELEVKRNQLFSLKLRMKIPSQIFSIQEFIALDEQSDIKLEFHNGTIVELSGADPIHNQIAARIIIDLGIVLDSKEEEYHILTSDTKIHIPDYNLFIYPDAVVVCRSIERSPDLPGAIINPLLIVEILSPSTTAHDRGDKFMQYKTLNSFREYVLIRQDIPYVNTFFKREKMAWEEREANGLDASIELQSIGVTLRLNRIYKGVGFEGSGE